MKAITVRNLPSEVAKAIERKARAERASLNRVVTTLLIEATGLQKEVRGKKKLKHDLDRFAGKWSRQDAEAFDAALKGQRSVDARDWK
jgi:hypothetical protein